MYLPKTNDNKNTDQGRVFQKPVNANAGLKVSLTELLILLVYKCFSLLSFSVVWVE